MKIKLLQMASLRYRCATSSFLFLCKFACTYYFQLCGIWSDNDWVQLSGHPWAIIGGSAVTSVKDKNEQSICCSSYVVYMCSGWPTCQISVTGANLEYSFRIWTLDVTLVRKCARAIRRKCWSNLNSINDKIFWDKCISTVDVMINSYYTYSPWML